MDRYRYEWVKGTYVIRKGCSPVLTPGGNPFSTIHENLAALICEDMVLYGPDPQDSLSYVTLHASYTDFGPTVAKSELIRSVLVHYRPDWDIALEQLSLLDSIVSWPSIVWGPAKSDMTTDLMVYFGSPEKISVVQAWLEHLSVRAVCSVQVCGAAFHSIHVGYRLLHPRSPISVSTLARGIVSLSGMIHPFFVVEDDPEDTEEHITAFLEKVKLYASFPDEKSS